MKKFVLEIWKDVVGYEGLYQVSNLGRVKSIIFPKNKDGKILKQRIRKGYLRIQLYKNKIAKDFGVHRLVALAFIPNPYNKPEIDHIDGIPSNNNVSNLKWCTPKENSNNPITISRKKEIMSIVNRKRIGIKLSEETKTNISKSRKGKYKGANNPFFGKKTFEKN